MWYAVKSLYEILFAALASIYLSMVIGGSGPINGCVQFVGVAAVGTSKGIHVFFFVQVLKRW